MAIQLTNKAILSTQRAQKTPNIILEIDGVGQVYGYLIVKKYAQIGDPDLEIGDPTIDDDAFYIGGLGIFEPQENAVTLNGTTTAINQLLQIDIGQGSSISTMSIALIDTGSITKLITPGNMLPDILQTRCKVYLGFADTAYPDDYAVIFRGVVTDVTSDAGKIILTLAHPDNKKQGSTFLKMQPNLVGAIDNVVTTITLDSTSQMLEPILGPDATYDPTFESCVIIENEVIKYTGISGNTLTGCVRGHLGTTAAAHTDGTQATTFYRLIGNCIDLALRLMASTGDQSNYLDGLRPTNFVDVDGAPIANSIYFQYIDVVEKYNIYIGDYITTSGASNGANNVTLKKILDIIETETGTYLLVDGVSFVSEDATAAVIGFRSQYDTWPDGLSLVNDDIDIDEHLRLQALFLNGFTYDFYIKDTITDTGTFIEQEIYLPIACFSLPRKSRCSIGYHIGPLPGQAVVTFDKTNIKNPSQMRLVRTTNRQFYNEIIYQFDEDIYTTDFLSGIITDSELSKAQIRAYNKTFTITSKGLRTANGAADICTSQSNKRLNWYQYAAEVLSFGSLFGDGFSVEIGDIVWIDGTNLQLPDIKTGIKGMAGRFFFVQNKKLNLATGDIQFDCVDTHFAGTGRYGLISPASIITVGTSLTQFTIGESFSGKYGAAEHKKWTSLIGAVVRVRSADFTTTANTTLVDVTTNNFVVGALPWVPSAGMIVELANYADQTLARAKLVYACMSDTAFADGSKQFVQL